MKNTHSNWCNRIRFPRFRNSVILCLIASFFSLYSCSTSSVIDTTGSSVLSTSSFIEIEKEDNYREQDSLMAQRLPYEVETLSESEYLNDDNISNIALIDGEISNSSISSSSYAESSLDVKPSEDESDIEVIEFAADLKSYEIEKENNYSEQGFLVSQRISPEVVTLSKSEYLNDDNISNIGLIDDEISNGSISSSSYTESPLDVKPLEDESDITVMEITTDLKSYEISKGFGASIETSQIEDEQSYDDINFSFNFNEEDLGQITVAEPHVETIRFDAQALDYPATNLNTETIFLTSIFDDTFASNEDYQPLSLKKPTPYSSLPVPSSVEIQKIPLDLSKAIDYRNENAISQKSTVDSLLSNDNLTLNVMESEKREASDVPSPKSAQSFGNATPSVTIFVLTITLLIIFFATFSRKKKGNKKPLYHGGDLSNRNIQPSIIQKSEEHQFIPDNSVLKGHESMFSARIVEDESSSTSYSIPKPPQNITTGIGAVRWVPPEKAIEVNGFHIDGGMLYVGSKIHGTIDPSFINTKLPVSGFTDYTVDSMGYWPNYSNISPSARGAYLAWLADGRKDPMAAPGYVFLFFYGLERRVLVDYQETRIEDAELQQIKNEINRLYSLYGGQSNSIKGYFSNFLNLLLLLERRNTKLYDWPIPENLKGYDIPFYLKVYLGQCSVDGKPLPARAAYLWVSYDPTVSKKTPARRCETELKQLFLLRYEEVFGPGLKLTPNKTKLKISYHAASSHLYGYSLNVDDYKNLPDVTVLSSISNKLKKLFDDCSNELDRYSRYLGKTGKELGNKKSLVFLPTELVIELKRDFLKTIHNQLVSNDSKPIRVSLLLKEILDEEMVTRETICALARVLEMYGISMEPDVLTYTYELNIENKVLLFINNEKAPKEHDNSTYLLNVLMVELSDAVARADGIVDDKEIKSIQQYLDSLEYINQYHKTRLRKHLEFLQHTPTNELSMKKKLKAIAPSDLSVLLASVNNVVLADGIIDHAEIQFLEKLYRYLDIDHSELYHQLHSPKAYGTLQIQDSERPLDYERVASLKKESAEVSSILSEIFLSDENDNLQEDQTITAEEEEQTNPLGLDNEQMEFLVDLVSKSSWSREELQEMAGHYGIMLDGTLEHVNENSLELYGLPVTEGDNPIEVLEEFRGGTVWL